MTHPDGRRISAFVAVGTLLVALLAAAGGEWVSMAGPYDSAVMNINPSSGFVGGGTPFTLTGSGFAANASNLPLYLDAMPGPGVCGSTAPIGTATTDSAGILQNGSGGSIPTCAGVGNHDVLLTDGTTVWKSAMFTVVPQSGSSSGGGGSSSDTPTPIPNITPVATTTPGPEPTTTIQTINASTGGTVVLGLNKVLVPSNVAGLVTSEVALMETVTITAQGSAPVLSSARVTATQLLPVPEGGVFGSQAFSFVLKDSGGSVLTLMKPIIVVTRYLSGDLQAANNSVANLTIMAYDQGGNRWVDLHATEGDDINSLTGESMITGTFALVVRTGAGTTPSPTGAPTIVGPTTGSVSSDLAPQLSWSTPAGATQYHLQVIPFNNDGPGINLIRNLETSYQIAAPQMGTGNYVMLPGMTYTWRVRTATSTVGLSETDSGWSQWGLGGGFQTAAPASATITSLAPIKESVVTTQRPTLEWSNTNPRIFYYEVQLSRDQNFGPNSFLYFELRHGAVTQPQNSYTVPSAFPVETASTYYWRVRPRVQGDGVGVAWSEVWSFRTP